MENQETSISNDEGQYGGHKKKIGKEKVISLMSAIVDEHPAYYTRRYIAKLSNLKNHNNHTFRPRDRYREK